jgi:hypothetical protein
VHDIIAFYDSDGSGGLDFDEFKHMLVNLDATAFNNMRAPGKAERRANIQAGRDFSATPWKDDAEPVTFGRAMSWDVHNAHPATKWKV